ncbi:DUF2968 domain-containing protein [Pigmentiphaga aceris]|uniref:DUF2968 domain-containing protein n=1 Tax=Pigmentiphaga aceris TaxID=1940612 RepID=A0A5C0ATK9_9BURK|nr:DUF2968 domain-containing protein [Pigmentiphaga aceris]QEI05652.1 DUF2968 domain-containing protein [Pigmentiphaga aceris]
MTVSARSAFSKLRMGLAIAMLPGLALAQTAPSSVNAPLAGTGNAVVSEAPVTNGIPGNSTVAELQQLIQDRSLNEMRTSYNGRYGASLLFKRDTLTYYVALFQQRNFWRVVKTDSESHAEQVYDSFVAQTRDLASVDLRRIRLDAERVRTERLIATNESRLGALQNDVLVRQQQEERVAAAQQQARQEAASLASEQQAARAQLINLERRIQTLEAENSGGIPPARSEGRGQSGRAQSGAAQSQPVSPARRASSSSASDVSQK